METSASTELIVDPVDSGHPVNIGCCWKLFACISKPIELLGKLSVKHNRIYVIMIALYHVMVSHLLMFLVVLALFHAEEMINLLVVDIADQKEREEYYELPMHSNGETVNQVRFKTGSERAAGTLSFLYASAIAVGTYLLCCLFLLCGAIKYRSQLMMPWLVVHAFGGTIIFWVSVYYYKWCVHILFDSYLLMATLVVVIGLLDMLFYSLCYNFFMNLRCMEKMTKSATVTIPCNGSGKTPYHYRKENMYIGDGGHKHRLDNCNPNYVV